MADNKELQNEEFEDEIITLTDEDGTELQFAVIGTVEDNGNTYYILIPQQDNEAGEYVILKLSKDENGEEILVTVDDDDECDRIADIVEDEMFNEVDYDAEESK